MNNCVVGRLAPSPTGALHLGNARSFLLAWLSARQQGGQVILRIEDIDSPRVKPWAVQATLTDLSWLGLDWDSGPVPYSIASETHAPNYSRCAEHARDVQAPEPSDRIAFIQTHRLPRYQQVLAQLIEAGVVYPCRCTRREVSEAASAPHENAGQALEGPVYPGTCRQQPFRPEELSADEKFAWRWHFAEGEVGFHDLRLGELRAHPKDQLGDFVIARGDGTPAYQLAVVVDDYDMGITEVVRGDDLVYSTFRQLAILQHLGWPQPNYAHVPLVVGPDGRRLAKRHGDTRLSYFREHGITAERIVGYLAWTLGMQADARATHPQELIGRLDWDKLPQQASVFHGKF